MTLQHYIQQAFYKTFKKEWDSYDCVYTIHDKKLDKTTEYHKSFVAENEQHAQKILNLYRETHLMLLEKKADGFGMFLPQTKGVKQKTKLFFAVSSGLYSAKKNVVNGFNLGGESPLALPQLLIETITTKAKCHIDKNSNVPTPSEKKLYALLFTQIFIFIFGVVTSTYCGIKHSIPPYLIFVIVSTLASVLIFIISTYKVIKHYYE
jgi:hypothetical protein